MGNKLNSYLTKKLNEYFNKGYKLKVEAVRDNRYILYKKDKEILIRILLTPSLTRKLRKNKEMLIEVMVVIEDAVNGKILEKEGFNYEEQ